MKNGLLHSQAPQANLTHVVSRHGLLVVLLLLCGMLLSPRETHAQGDGDDSYIYLPNLSSGQESVDDSDPTDPDPTDPDPTDPDPTDPDPTDPDPTDPDPTDPDPTDPDPTDPDPTDPDPTDPAIPGWDESKDDTKAVEAQDTVLLTEAKALLPVPKNLAAPIDKPVTVKDVDGDGVPDATDLCPFQPNPPVNGKQQPVCGNQLAGLVDQYVFLQSRIFAPTQGIDPNLAKTQVRDRVHVMLHVRPQENGVVLSPARHKELTGRKVTVLEYLPHNTFLVSLPRDPKFVQQLLGLETVYGLSALRPADKVSPSLRVQGPVMGRNDNGTLSVMVDFFEDVSQAEIEAFLTTAGYTFVLHYDQTYAITTATWANLQPLAIQDIVMWLDDMPDVPRARTLNAQGEMNGLMMNSSGFRGVGLTVSMSEPYLADPIDHPAMVGRITFGNQPLLENLKPYVPETIGGLDHPRRVASIMIADDPNFPAQIGLLPDANVVSYSVIGPTAKAQHYGIPRQAREDFDAILNNNSWGPTNCLKRGQYTARGKFFDRAVRDIGIPIIYAAGNTRGPNGDFSGFVPSPLDPTGMLLGCRSDLYSLPHPVAKNDLSIGNWSLTGDGGNAVSGTSASGPAFDERLKPDLLAPGNGVATVNLTSTLTLTGSIHTVFADTFGGTSAAAPVASGVVGYLVESFLNQGTLLDDIPPARLKAILIHTARDVGPPGPDFLHGYGLIQVDKAIRIAEEWSKWGREDTMDATTTQFIYEFDVDSPMTFYKATLAWDDVEGSFMGSVSLKNDLDLTLISPSGVTFFPFNLGLPIGATVDPGSSPCASPTCQDRLNNVEMVRVNAPFNGYVEQGQWTAVVDVHRMVSDDQPFSLVLTPPCPVEVEHSVTLIGNIECSPSEFAPSVVLIEQDDIELNCDGHVIIGTLAAGGRAPDQTVGILVKGSNVTIRNCEVRQFDIGIQVSDAALLVTNAQILSNTVRLIADSGILLRGADHTVQGNSVSQMTTAGGTGIDLQGNNMVLRENRFGTAQVGAAASNNVGIDVRAPSLNGDLVDNSFGGLWGYGIRLRSDIGTQTINTFDLLDNTFEGVRFVPIRVEGSVLNTTINGNSMVGFGLDQAGIEAITSPSNFVPVNTTITGNTIGGNANGKQVGIRVVGTDKTLVGQNTLRTLFIGISETDASRSQIVENEINPAPMNALFRSSVAIESTRSGGEVVSGNLRHMIGNQILQSTLGIVVNQPDASMVANNKLTADNTGISINGQGVAVAVSSNTVTAGAVGIAVGSGPASVISGNSLAAITIRSGIGVDVNASNGAEVRNNTVTELGIGMRVRNSTAAEIVDNVISDPGSAGILVAQDTQALISRNSITKNGSIGIHYQEGTQATITRNTIASPGTGIGVRLGTSDVEPCVLRVDEVEVSDNTFTNHAKDVEVLCDVGDVTIN